MSAFLKRLRSRAADKIDRAAAGSAVPAGQDAAAGDRSRPTAHERGSMRRRLRELRRLREALLLELGALAFELRRRDRDADSELFAGKVEELEQLEAEAQMLGRALGEETTVVELVSAGVAGACPRCGTLVSTRARFCSSCGIELSRARSPGAGGENAGEGPAGDRDHGAAEADGDATSGAVASARAETGTGT